MNKLPFDNTVAVEAKLNLKQITLDRGNYFVMPAWLCMLDFDEAFIYGYLIDTENVVHLTYEYEGEEYFMCDVEDFMLKMFVNSNARKIRRVMDSLIEKGLIKKIILRDGSQKHTYIKINYKTYDEYAEMFQVRKKEKAKKSAPVVVKVEPVKC